MNLSMDPMFIIAPTMNLYAYQEIEGEVVDGHWSYFAYLSHLYSYIQNSYEVADIRNTTGIWRKLVYCHILAKLPGLCFNNKPWTELGVGGDTGTI